MNKTKIVVKFGGSNLKRKEDVERLVQVVKHYRQPLVIVVSALYGVTNSLVKTLHDVKTDEEAIARVKQNLATAHHDIIELYIQDKTLRENTIHKLDRRIAELEKYLRSIHLLGEIPDFVEDRVLSYGERLSALVFTAILNDRNIPCSECLPENLGLYTNGEYRNATVDFSISEKIVSETLSDDKLFVVPGFYGISRDSRVNLFGRGGSDYTAAAIARCINASSVDLWKDVCGFMSADPKCVDGAKRIEQLSYNEAAELSYFGARILHPRTFEPLLERNIPIRIFNITHFSETLQPVTVINEVGSPAPEIVKSISMTDDFGILRLHGAGVGIKPGIMATVTSRLNERGINIKSIITAQTTINILLSLENLDESFKIVEAIGLPTLDRIEKVNDISLIAVVGDGLLEKPGIAARVFSAVSLHHINVRMISGGASNEAIYFVTDKKESKKAIHSIHAEFFSNSSESNPLSSPH